MDLSILFHLHTLMILISCLSHKVICGLVIFLVSGRSETYNAKQKQPGCT